MILLSFCLSLSHSSKGYIGCHIALHTRHIPVLEVVAVDQHYKVTLQLGHLQVEIYSPSVLLHWCDSEPNPTSVSHGSRHGVFAEFSMQAVEFIL